MNVPLEKIEHHEPVLNRTLAHDPSLADVRHIANSATTINRAPIRGPRPGTGSKPRRKRR